MLLDVFVFFVSKAPANMIVPQKLLGNNLVREYIEMVSLGM